jgi:hypothetical protein
MLPVHPTRDVKIMAWTWKQIEQDWLGDGQVASDPSAVVAAFERVEAALAVTGSSSHESTRWWCPSAHHRRPRSFEAQIQS